MASDNENLTRIIREAIEEANKNHSKREFDNAERLIELEGKRNDVQSKKTIDKRRGTYTRLTFILICTIVASQILAIFLQGFDIFNPDNKALYIFLGSTGLGIHPLAKMVYRHLFPA